MVKVLAVVVAVALVGCGGAAFTAAEPADGGADALQVADGGPEAAAQGEDGGADAPAEVASQGGHDGGDGWHLEAGGDAGTEADAGRACITDLSGVGTGDFHVSFEITTTAHGVVNLVQQQVGCTQSSVLWSVWLNISGQIAAGTSDGNMAHWVAIAGASNVADGQPHAIVFARTSGKISISRDGAVDSTPVADPYSLGALPPLRIGTGDCTTAEPAADAGTIISNVCITRE